MADTPVLAALTKGLVDLRTDVAALAREPGPAGDDGRDGRDGTDGKDGRDGKDGADGIDGKDGKDGRDGIDGKDGRDGADGKDGDTGPMPKHEWRGTQLRFQKAPRKWGEWVDLRGPAGPARIAIAGGAGGDAAGAFQIDQRLGEIAGNQEAQEQAQQNLGLGVSDLVAYYILAKS